MYGNSYQPSSFVGMDIRQQLQENLQRAFQALFEVSIPLSSIRLQPTRKEFQGTHTLATFPFVATCRASYEDIAYKLGKWLKTYTDVVADFHVVKGFLNLSVQDTAWLAQLRHIQQDPHFGYMPGNGQRVVIEFSSPNTNKPLHLGHLRNNCIGHAITQILQAAGYTTYAVSLVNDRGIHICKSMVAYQRWGHGATPASARLKGDHFVGDYYVQFDQAYKQERQVAPGSSPPPILQEAQALLQRWEAHDPDVMALWEKMNGWVYAGFASTYQRLGIHFDKTYYESQTYLLGKKMVAEGLAKGIFYQRSDGSVWVDLSDEGLDEKLVLRSDGTAVYLTQDLGAADVRYQDYAFDKSMYVVGDEQDYHFSVLSKILKRLGRPYASQLVHLSYGMVDLPTGKMKSREGTVVDADQLLDTMTDTAEAHTRRLGKIEDFSSAEAQRLYRMLALGALKYFLLRVDSKKRLLFDPQASIDFQGDTGPFIQYTYARIAAVLRKAPEKGVVIDVLPKDVATPLVAVERVLINGLGMLPAKIREAADGLDPSIMAQYAFDLAKAFNRFYAEVSILYEGDVAKQQVRVCIAFCVARTLQRVMGLLGVEVPERM
ncbi:MAG: arginine--tRNA ligase [Bacteroidota bacterium]